MEFIHHFFFILSSLCSHPLFSTIVTLYTLLLLYAPSFFLTIAFSPVLNSAGIVLLSLLRLGANERLEKKSNSQELETVETSENKRSEKESSCLESRLVCHKDNHNKWLPINRGNLTLCSDLTLESSSRESRFLYFIDENRFKVGFERKSSLHIHQNQTDAEFEYAIGLKSNSHGGHQKLELSETNSTESCRMVKEGEATMELDQKQVAFLEWNVKAPLQIIYEGEEDQESDRNNEVPNDKKVTSCERYPSLWMYYPESVTDRSSDDDGFLVNENWETHESVFSKWNDKEEEEEEEELIEISLDRYGKKSIKFCYADEDNLIEVDIFPNEFERQGKEFHYNFDKSPN